jgi:hypothetical protein
MGGAKSATPARAAALIFLDLIPCRLEVRGRAAPFAEFSAPALVCAQVD